MRTKFTFKNSREAAGAFAAKSRTLGEIFKEADAGEGVVDLMKVSSLSGDAIARQEEVARLVQEMQEVGHERVRLEDLEGMRSISAQALTDSTTPAESTLHLPGATNGRRRIATMGERFVQSESWQTYLSSIRPKDGHVGEKTRVNSPQIFLNALIVEGDPESGGAFLVPQQTGIVVPLPMRQLTLLDLVTFGQTSTETVEYVRITELTNNATGVAESTSTEDPVVMDAASGVKPESEMKFLRVQANVQNIAHWIPATKRALSDASQLRTMIDNFLRAGVREELERQAIEGTGTGEEIEGFSTVNTLHQAYSATLDGDGLDPVFETTRKALTKIQLARGITPTAFVFHPQDWEAVDLARMVKNPQNEATTGGIRQLHGYPVALSEVVTQGQAWVGDFRQYVIWDREQTSITVSDSHANFFIRNLVAILAEMRAAGGLLRTDAICDIDLTAL